MLWFCRGKARAAGEISEQSSLAIATVSEHLKVLRKSGLMILDKRGRHWFYETNTQLLDTVPQWLAHTLREGEL